MALSATEIRDAKPKNRPYRMYEGSSLYLEVRPTGKKFWRVSYRDQDQRDRTKTLGEYPDIGLIAARNQASEIVRDNRPSSYVAKSSSLSEVAKEWFDAQKAKWVEAHAQRVWSRIERDLLPDLGNKDVSKIKPLEILEVLQKVEERGAIDISKRLRQNLEGIYRYAIRTERAENNPAIGLNDALKAMPKPKHMAAIDFDDLPGFFVKFNQSGVQEKTKLGLMFLMLTCTRTNEIYSAEWKDIKGNLWTIPGHKMKREKDHLIPLSKQARKVLDRLRPMSDGELVVDLTQNALIHAIYKMGYKGKLTVHGFRSIFSTHANDSGLWRDDAIERALAHVPNNKVRSAYNRSLYLDERRKMLQWWADEIDKQKDLAELLG